MAVALTVGVRVMIVALQHRVTDAGYVGLGQVFSGILPDAAISARPARSSASARASVYPAAPMPRRTPGRVSSVNGSRLICAAPSRRESHRPRLRTRGWEPNCPVIGGIKPRPRPHPQAAAPGQFDARPRSVHRNTRLALPAQTLAAGPRRRRGYSFAMETATPSAVQALRPRSPRPRHGAQRWARAHDGKLLHQLPSLLRAQRAIACNWLFNSSTGPHRGRSPRCAPTARPGAARTSVSGVCPSCRRGRHRACWARGWHAVYPV